jgi:hypothetical protein
MDQVQDHRLGQVEGGGMSKKHQIEGPFTPIRWEVMDAPAFLAARPNARWVYIALLRQAVS